MSAPPSIAADVLIKARDLLFMRKKVDYVAQHLNIARAHVIEAGFGAGLRYDPKEDVMTSRPAALDHDPEPLPAQASKAKPKKAAATPAHLLPPKPAVVVDPPIVARPDLPVGVVVMEKDTAVDVVVDSSKPEIANPQVNASKPAPKRDMIHVRDGELIPGTQKRKGDRVRLEVLGDTVTGTVIGYRDHPRLGIFVDLDEPIMGERRILAGESELLSEWGWTPEPAAPVDVPFTKLHADDAQPLEIGSVDALLERVRFTDDDNVRAAARAVWSTVRVLQEALTRAAALADVTAAKQRLDEANAAADAARLDYLRKAALAGDTPLGHAARGALAAENIRSMLAETGLSSAELRVWARENGVACPTAGTVPRRVLNAWLEANHPNGKELST